MIDLLVSPRFTINRERKKWFAAAVRSSVHERKREVEYYNRLAPWSSNAKQASLRVSNTRSLFSSLLLSFSSATSTVFYLYAPRSFLVKASFSFRDCLPPSHECPIMTLSMILIIRLSALSLKTPNSSLIDDFIMLQHCLTHLCISEGIEMQSLNVLIIQVCNVRDV